jgi:phage terminase small subunit
MIDQPRRRKRYPRALQVSGKTLWNNIINQYALDPAEHVLLEQLCRTVDVLDRINADLDEMGVTVSGSTGQPRVNPLLAERREQIKIVDRLQMALALPVAGEPQGRRRSGQAKATAKQGRAPKINRSVAHMQRRVVS